MLLASLFHSSIKTYQYQGLLFIDTHYKIYYFLVTGPTIISYKPYFCYYTHVGHIVFVHGKPFMYQCNLRLPEVSMYQCSSIVVRTDLILVLEVYFADSIKEFLSAD